MHTVTSNLICAAVLLQFLAVLAPPAAAAAGTPTAAAETFQPCAWTDLDSAVQRFSEIIQFHTVGNASHPDHADPVVWDLLELWLRDAYSDVFQALQVEKVRT